MIPDRLHYVLDDFWNFEILSKYERSPPDYDQHALKHTRKVMGTSWKHIIFVNMGLKKFDLFENMYDLCIFQDFEYLIC